jgi:hypothetical protein
MPAPSKSFTALLDAEIAAGKRLTTEKMTKLRDALVHLEEWLGMDYTAAQNHNHDGVNSAEIEVGPNYLRNSSFEQGTTSWTTAAYTGGSVGTNTSNDMDGAQCLALTSTVLANGGGEAYSTGYTPVAGGRVYDAGAMVKGSVTGQSAKVSIIWYDDALAQISESTVYSTTSERTASHMVANRLLAPATARYARVKLVGGVPASGSATGTVYFDGAFLAAVPESAIPGSAAVLTSATYPSAVTPSAATVFTNSGSYTELLNFYASVGGVYTVIFDYGTSNGATSSAFARIYVDGVATGTERSTNANNVWVNATEDILIPPGGTLQIFAKTTNPGVDKAALNNVMFKVGNCPKMVPFDSVLRITNGLRP